MPRSVVLQATLRDQDNNPVSGKTIAFKYRVSGASTWSDGGTAQTNTSGVASVTLNLSVPQTYDFRAEFAGDTDYESSYAELLNQKIKAKTTITLTVTPQ
jgi:hypothetical protein